MKKLPFSRRKNAFPDKPKAMLTACLALFLTTAFCQKNLNLQDCYRLAEANTAIAQNPPLLEKLTQLRLQNLEAARLPSVQWNAKATWQNEVFGLPFDFPGVDINIPHYNIATSLEATYLLYDGGITEAKKTMERAKLAVDNQAVVVELNKLKEQVNQYFFGALLLQEQTKLLEVTQKDLEAKAQQIEAGVKHGAVLESELKKIQVEQLKIRSKIGELASDRRALLTVLASLTGQFFDENTQLETPKRQAAIGGGEVRRPELTLFDLQKTQVLSASQMIAAPWKPKLSAFAQAGVGYPDPLNFFDDKISPYGLVGLHFSWKILDWKQAGREQEQLTLQSQLIDNQKRTFTQNISHFDGKFAEEIKKIERLIADDEEIAKLQDEILTQLSSQLENGVITATDYLLQSDAALQARLSAQARRVQVAQMEAMWGVLRGGL